MGGRIVLVEVPTGIPRQIPTAPLIGRQQTVHGMTVGCRSHQTQMIQDLPRMDLRPVIDKSSPIGKIAGVFQVLENGPHFDKLGIAY